MTETILSVDPGRAKCGVAVASGPNPFAVKEMRVVDSARLTLEVSALCRLYPEISLLLVGNGTGSADLRSALQGAFPKLPIVVAPEHGTSLLARARFLAEIPPKGWRRILPPGLRAPEKPYDDYVALILAERYFEK